MSDNLRRLAAVMAGDSDPIRFRQGVVSAVNADSTVSVTLGGAAGTLTNVRCLAHVMPVPGQTVWCAKLKGDLLVVGVQQDATTGQTSTDTTGFTGATNFTLSSISWRVMWPFAWIRFNYARTGSTFVVSASGNIANTDVAAATPTFLRPANGQPLGSYSVGRVATHQYNADGSVTLVACAPGADILVGDTLSCAGIYAVA